MTDFVFGFLFLFSPPAFSTSPGNQNPGTHVHPDDAEQQAALLLACSGDNLPPSLPPVNMYDLLEALKVMSVVSESITMLVKK